MTMTQNCSNLDNLSIYHHLSSKVEANPYSTVSRLALGRYYMLAGYPDLAAGEAYLSLLLIDEIGDESAEWHEQTVHAAIMDLKAQDELHDERQSEDKDTSREVDENVFSNNSTIIRRWERDTYRMLASCLLACGNLRSAAEFCHRGLKTHPSDPELVAIEDQIETKAGNKGPPNSTTPRIWSMEDFSDKGLVRREIYPWNSHEPDRYSEESVKYLNEIMQKVAPKLAVGITELDDLAALKSINKSPKTKQLGIFAKEDLQTGEIVLDELSFLTATSRINDTLCDACSASLTMSAEQSPVPCQECLEAVFCSSSCADSAPLSYHAVLCGADVSSLAKEDIPPTEAADALYFLLVARAIAMAETRGLHPLDLNEVKWIWGDFVSFQDDPALASAGPFLDPHNGRQTTLPFSFKYHVLMPLHLLEKLDINPFTASNYNTWVINTLFAKFRGVASARQSLAGDGRPEVAAVHPLWCLANHSCDPNVKWEWQGGMRFWTRSKEELVMWGTPKRSRSDWNGIEAGEEILSHYCDVDLEVRERREWAAGALGGPCQCPRCVWEASQDKCIDSA